MPAAIQLLRRHAVALLVTAVAFVFTLFLWPFSHRFPFALFIAAVLASAWQGGPRSALITTILSGAILFGLYWLFSADQIAELGFDYLTRLGLFLFVGLLASYLSHQCRKATRALEVAGATLAGAGQALIFVDGQSRVTSLNSLAETLTGWTPEEAIGRPVEQVFHLREEKSGQPLECPVGT